MSTRRTRPTRKRTQQTPPPVQQAPDAESGASHADVSSGQFLLNLSQVIKKVRMSRTWIYSAMDRGAFPRPICTGKRSVRWIAAEIDAWIESRPRGGGCR